MKIDRLLDIMEQLRDPETGCAWDREQEFATIAPYTIEEAYEVADAIDHEDMGNLRDELGDLLFQVVFHARMAEERGAFAFADVVEGICDKMIRRHPHVFGDKKIETAAAQTIHWESLKRAERAEGGANTSQLDGIPGALPALLRAEKLGKRAAQTGFDWPTGAGALAKVDEELAELRTELTPAAVDQEKIEEEFGDLLFSIVNLARHLNVRSEEALRRANAKFDRRFREVERRAKANGEKPLDSMDIDEMEDLWKAVKRDEGTATG